MADWLTRYHRKSADRLNGALWWAPVPFGAVVAVFTALVLFERWSSEAAAEGAERGVSVLFALGAGALAGVIAAALAFGFILGLYFVTERLSQR